MNYSANTYNLQFVLRSISQALHKNYLYNQDKYSYAKSISSSLVRWRKCNFSEKIISNAYIFYNQPYKFKKMLFEISYIELPIIN